MNPSSVADIFVAEALASGARAGVDTDQLLVDLGLGNVGIGEMTTAQFGQVWLELSQLMQDEFFGLGARPLRPGSTTLLGHAIRGGPNVGRVVKRILRFLNAMLDDPFGTIAVKGGRCTISVTEKNRSGNAFKFRAYFLILHGFTCWAARERIPILDIHFPCAEPAGQTDYGDFFGVPVRFDAPLAQLTFDASFLRRTVNHSDADLKAFLRSLPEAFLRGYRDTTGIKHAIMERCLSGPPADWPDASGVAKALGMSRSTLHRQMARAGHSLQQLKDEQRRNRATALLSRTELTIAEVSAAVGYAEDAAFYRAFRRWYGTHPSELRRTKPPM